MATELKNLNEFEVKELHIKTILDLEKSKKFTYLTNFKNKTIKKLFKKYLVQIKNEQII